MTSRRPPRSTALETLEDRRLLAAGPEFQLTNGTPFEFDVAAADNGRAVYAYPWGHSEGDFDGERILSTEAFVRLSDAAGVPTGPAFRVSEQFTEFDALLMRRRAFQISEVDVAADADGDFVVAWTKFITDSYTGAAESGPVWVRRFTAAVAPRGPDVMLTEFSGGGGVDVAAEPDGDFVVAYGTFDGIVVRRFDASGAARGGAVAVDDRNMNTWQSSPSIAVADDGRFVVAWKTGSANPEPIGDHRFTVRAQRFGADGRPAGGSFAVRDLPGYSEEAPQVAMNRSAEFVVGWYSGYYNNGDGPERGVYVRRYDAAGATRGEAFKIPNAGDLAVALDDAGNLFASWYQGDPTRDSDVYARRYGPQNQPLEAPFRVNSTTGGPQGEPAAAVDAAGRVTVVWADLYSDPEPGDGLFGRRYTFGNTTPDPHPEPDPDPRPRTGSIAGSVFNDANGDGRRQRAEAGISGRRVWLDLDDDGARDASEPSLLTDSRGVYRFSGIAAGTYRVRQVLPSGWRTSYPASGAHRVTLAEGAAVVGKNFATTRNLLISGTVFNDANRDGRKNSGEAGLSGWRVYVDADNDGRFDSGEKSVLTDSSGNWRFTSLAAGTHRVRVVQQSGWSRTTPTGGVHTLTLSSGATATGKLFGQRRA